jgi:GTP-binding protein HflX
MTRPEATSGSSQLFDRPERGERAVLVHVSLGHTPLPEETGEFAALASSAGAEVVGAVSAPLRAINPRFLLGTGKVAEVKALADSLQAEVVLVDHHLSPAQERNLERELCRRVVDRSGLILDIFAQRARTFEGKLQVELAQLEHLATRLVRGWSHLERQKGGIGLRGPGETQLETDRRLLSKRIRQLQERLARHVRHRELSRQQRRRHEVPVVSLVGYTNAGKSTLFNRLTDARTYVADQLFATLDPTLRAVDLPGGSRMVLADTVGFVRDLPHELIAAFESTLEETRSARLLLHVVDAADPAHVERIEQVNAVLREIGAGHLPVILVYNKADILAQAPRVDRSETGAPGRVWLSAATGAGVDLLLGAITEYLHQDVFRGTVRLAVDQARARALLYEMGEVRRETVLAEGGWELDVELEKIVFDDLQRRESLVVVTAFTSPSGGQRAEVVASHGVE